MGCGRTTYFLIGPKQDNRSHKVVVESYIRVGEGGDE